MKNKNIVMKNLSEVTSILNLFRWESPMGFSSLRHANFWRVLAMWLPPPLSWGPRGTYSLLDRLYSKVLSKKDTILRLIVLYMKRKRLPNNYSLTKEMKVHFCQLDDISNDNDFFLKGIKFPRKKVCWVSPIFQILPPPIWYPMGWLIALHVKKGKKTGKNE